MRALRELTARKILVMGVGVCLVLEGWVFWRERAGATAFRSATDLIAALPRSAASPTDTVVANLAEKLTRDPQDEDSWTDMGDALMQKARETMDLRYYGHAQMAFQRALALNSKNTQAIVGLSWVYSGRHEFERSVEWARKALALDPDDPAAYGLLGDAALEMGNYDAALDHYQRMLDIRPDLSSYSRGAHLLFVMGDTRKATWLMQKAIAAGAPHAENTAWCRAQLALMQWKTGALVPAEQTLEVGLKVAPANYHLLAAMGRIMTARKDYNGAIEYYQKARAIAPQHEVIVALGDLYALTGKREEAEQQFALLEAIHESNKVNGVRGNVEMARFYADHDRKLTEALSIAEAEYKKIPNVFAADTLAWSYYKNGRYEDARKMIEKALIRRTPEAGFLFHAGMIYAKLGNRPAAQRYLYQALSLNPSFNPLEASVAADTIAQLGSPVKHERSREAGAR